MGTFEDRVARLEARLFGPTKRTRMVEEQERKAAIGRLYLSWSRGEAEKPGLDDPEDLRLWAMMEEYEAVAVKVAERVANKGGDDMSTEDDLRRLLEGLPGEEGLARLLEDAPTGEDLLRLLPPAEEVERDLHRILADLSPREE